MKLEKFIKENRAAFDQKEPSKGLWNKIVVEMEQGNEPVSHFSFPWRSMGIAASIALLLSLGYFAGRYGRPMSDNRDIISLSASHGTSVVRYETFIADKRQKLETMSMLNPKMVSDFEADLDELNSSYVKLRAMLPNNPNQERILNKMVKNLKWQIELLNKQLELMESMESEEVVIVSEELNLKVI